MNTYGRILFSFLTGCILMGTTYAQSDNTLITIGDNKISKQEFEAVYKKNNTKQTAATEQSLREYLDLYINFRLKVKEAEAMGLDSAVSFKKELAGYRRQLAQPYLTDKDVSDKLIKEAYDRAQKEIRASHILINCDPNASPKDTMAAYKKTMSLRKKILSGENFDKLAAEFSQDPSAKQNSGDLGYFTVFTMVYPFETAAYNTPLNQVSMPIRTRYGYHLVKLTDSRAAQGEIKVAHILIKLTPQMKVEDSLKAKEQIDEVYRRLQAGERFEILASQFSEDKGSARDGGVINRYFGTGKMIPSFESAAFALTKNGEYSAPFRTQFGWHIVQRVDRKPLASFEEMLSTLKRNIQQDSRSDLNKQSFINKLKKKYTVVEYPKALDEFTKVVDSSIYKGKWEKERAKGLTKTLFLYGASGKNQGDFAAYFETNQMQAEGAPIKVAVKMLYENYLAEVLTAEADANLENDYPDFKALITEYRDGILLFELTDKTVWNKAVQDSAGLANFFQANAAKYQWQQRLDAVIYTCATKEIAAQVRKAIKKSGADLENIQTEINKSNPLNLAIKKGKFERGDNKIIDGIEWKKGTTKDIIEGTSTVFVEVKAVLAPATKELAEVRGAVIAEYQNKLEKDWIDSLRAKYPVTVNEALFGTLLNK